MKNIIISNKLKVLLYGILIGLSYWLFMVYFFNFLDWFLKLPRYFLHYIFGALVLLGGSFLSYITFKIKG